MRGILREARSRPTENVALHIDVEIRRKNNAIQAKAARDEAKKQREKEDINTENILEG